MSNPFPGINVSFETQKYKIDTTDIQNQTIKPYSGTVDITNYDYELQKNNDKRQILVLKPEYLAAFISDMRNIMKYPKSQQSLDDKTKRVYNPKIKGD